MTDYLTLVRRSGSNWYVFNGKLSDCPFDPLSAEGRAWSGGYLAAQREHEISEQEADGHFRDTA